jgi:hypothetical protein
MSVDLITAWPGWTITALSKHGHVQHHVVAWAPDGKRLAPVTPEGRWAGFGRPEDHDDLRLLLTDPDDHTTLWHPEYRMWTRLSDAIADPVLWTVEGI